MMKTVPYRAVALLVALAALAVAGCDSGDIHALAQSEGGCPRPGPFTVVSGAGPTINPDGSLTFSGISSSNIIMNRLFADTTQASLCAEFTLTSSTYFGGGMGALAGEGLSTEATWGGAGQINANYNDNPSGTGCSPQPILNPAYVVGGRVHLVSRLDQTGAGPVIRSWFDTDPAGPPQIDSSSLWCAGVSTAWGFTPGLEAYIQATDVTVHRFGFGP